MRSRPFLLAASTFVAAWLIYVQVIPLVLVTWKITGDEPHYLLAAHSLVYDHDLDLANNYANRAYASFYVGAYLDPHVKLRPDGAQLPSHDIGLPLAIALPYALGGRAGVMQFFAALGALLAAQMTLLGWEASGRWWAGLFGGLALALSAPLSLYVFQIYPEMMGGLLLIWAVRQILNTPGWIEPEDKSREEKSASPFFLLPVALGFLPWLSGRYAPLVVMLIALMIWKHWPHRRMWLTVSGISLASLAMYLAVNFTFYGGPTPSVTSGGNAVLSGFNDVSGQQVGRGLMGWWLDQHRGLLIFGPALVIAFIGLPHLWRLRGPTGALLFAPVISMWVLASVWGSFYSGWEVSAKFLMVGVPPMAAGVTAAFAGITDRLRKVLFWPLAAGLITLGVCNGVIMWLDPFVMLHESPVAFWEHASGYRLREYFPAAGTRYIEYPPGGASEWRAPKGQSGYLHQSRAIAELSIGWYALYAQAQLTHADDPNAAALSLDAYSSEAGLPLFHADVRPREADPATGFVNIRAPFFNPYVDRWNYPFYLDVRTTGAADVRLTRLLFEPDPWPTYGWAGMWILVMLTVTAWFAFPQAKKG